MPSRIARWIGLLIIAGIFAVLLIHGSKYLNFVADQLLLYGRTDGDMMFHGAIVNAFRYFHFPSTGIDGLRLLHYHVGLDAIASLIATGTSFNAVLSLVVLRAEILFPAAVFAIGWAAVTLGRLLMPKLEFNGLSISAASTVMFLLIESGRLTGLTLANDPMLLSGVYLVLLMPAVLACLAEPENRTGEATLRRPMLWHPVWLLALVAIFFLSAMKISAGYVWTGLLGFWVLRLLSPKRPAFWLIGAVAATAFLACYWIFNDSAGSGGSMLFGTPYYWERGFAKGDYLMPLRQHSHVIAALILLWLLRRVSEPKPFRLLAESFGFMIVIANLPGLLMEIPGGDAIFFTRTFEWLATPLLALGIALLPQYLSRIAPGRRKLGWGVAALILIGLVVDAATLTPTRINTLIAGAALLHTGDRSYYAGDNRRTWRLDAQRAMKEYGAAGLFRLPPPPPTGAGLADALNAYRAEYGSDGAAYLPPQSDYWAMVSDCDGKSLWPMTIAGVPLVDGYIPVQSECPQEFAVSGYSTPPVARHDLSDSELCKRATDVGFVEVLRIDSLSDRARDRRLNCKP
jgi:hypothetical protein